MNDLSGPDPLDRLRAADPIRPDDVPDASLARVSARIQEHIVTDNQRTSNPAPKRRPFALFRGLALSGALALAVFVSNGLGAPTPTPGAGPTDGPTAGATDGPIVGGGMASCIRYDPAILPTFDVVFDGVVTAVDGDKVTFDVKHGWKGVDNHVTLNAPHSSPALLGPLPDFKVDGRYLVTAAEGNVNSCGYTLDYDAKTASEWAAAFGG